MVTRKRIKNLLSLVESHTAHLLDHRPADNMKAALPPETTQLKPASKRRKRRVPAHQMAVSTP
jgi:hypothetical protein